VLTTYKHLLTGLFPPAVPDAGDVDLYAVAESDGFHVAQDKLLQSDALSSRVSWSGTLPLGRLNELSLEFLQCPACFGLIPSTGYLLHTMQCAQSAAPLSADPNIQQPPLFNHNYPPVYPPSTAQQAMQSANVTQGLLPLPPPLQLLLPLRKNKHPHMRSLLVPRDATSAAGLSSAGLSSVGSKAQAQQAYLLALQDIDGRLTRFRTRSGT